MLFSLPWAFPVCGQVEQVEWQGLFGFICAITFALIVGAGLWWVGHKETGNVLHKEALAIVGLGWLLAGIVGAIPYWLGGCHRAPGVPMGFHDALFESVSGFTTTGASVLTELEDPALVPRCVLFWRSFTHWLGGMGIVVLFVALLGHLGATGKALMKREVPGPFSDSVRPRIRETALTLWAIYVGLTALLTGIFTLEGMDLYNALCHTFGTLATGGFSTFNSSVGHFDSITIEMTIVFFMIVAGTNFSLFYMVARGMTGVRNRRWWDRLRPLTHDPEFKLYLAIIAISTLTLAVSLYWTNRYGIGSGLRHGLFISVAIMTTTGFGTVDFSQWSEFSKGLLLLLMFVGGCAGSTAGGMKVIRFLLFFKVIRMEIEQAFRPNVVRTLRVGKLAVDDSLRHGVVVYFSLILFIFISSWMILNAIEPDTQWVSAENHTKAEKLLDCASAVATSLNNIGPGLGVLGPASNFSGFSPQGKLLLTVLMLLGRLELFAILVLFFPSFWRSQ